MAVRRWAVLDRPQRSRWRSASVFALAMLCGAAVSHPVTLMISQWRTTAEDARALLVDASAPLPQRENAAYVLLRNELANSEAALKAAAEPGVAGDHARNLVKAARKAWGQ